MRVYSMRGTTASVVRDKMHGLIRSITPTASIKKVCEGTINDSLNISAHCRTPLGESPWAQVSAPLMCLFIQVFLQRTWMGPQIPTNPSISYLRTRTHETTCPYSNMRYDIYIYMFLSRRIFRLVSTVGPSPTNLLGRRSEDQATS